MMSELRLRVFHQLERPRNGREIVLSVSASAAAAAVPANAIVDALRAAAVLDKYDPHVYHPNHQCFVSLTQLAAAPVPSSLQLHEAEAGLPPRIDVKLVDRVHVAAPATLAERLLCDSAATSLSGSWFAIGIIRGKAASNHGSLWRSALQFGAAMTFTIGKRYQKNVEGCADIYKTHRQVPCIAYQDTTSFMDNAPVDAQIVVVEYGGTDLTHFQHPKRALYVLGAEDNGVPPAFVRRAHCHVSIPTADSRPTSLNVAAAGAIILYDRFTKLSNKVQNKQSS